jgi:hypothetical protein
LEAQTRPTPSIDAVVAIAQLVRAQIDAEEAARRGEYEEARQVMVLFQGAVAARGHHAVATAAEKISERVGDADAYRGSAAYRSSMRKGSSRGVVTLYQSDALKDLRSMGQGKTTEAQDRMAEAFGGKSEPAKRRGTKSSARGLVRRRSKRW